MARPKPRSIPHVVRGAREHSLEVSTANAAFQVLESLLTNRTKRHKTRTFLLEGVLPLARALDHGWRFEAIVHASDARLSDWARDLVARASPARTYAMAPPLMARLSGRAEGTELLAVVRMADGGLERIPVGPDLLAVVVDRPGNPGNLGTIVRSCDALGGHGVITTGHGVDVYEPGVITASRGSLFAVPVVPCPSHETVAEWLTMVRAQLGPCQLVGADEDGGAELGECDFRRPTVLAFGNETRGLSRVYRDLCDARVRIPMTGAATSLNVAAAASIALYEVGRQRRLDLRRPGR